MVKTALYKKPWVRFFVIYFTSFLVGSFLIYGIGSGIRYAILSNTRFKGIEYSLNETSAQLDDTFGRLRIILNQNIGTEWVDKYVNRTLLDDDTLGKDAYEIYQIQKSMKHQTIVFNEIDLLGVYFQNSGLVIDNQSCYKASEYFKSCIIVDDVYENQWYAWAEGHSTFKLISVSGGEIHGKRVDGVIAIKTIPGNSIKGKGILFIVANNSMFYKLIKPLEEEGLSCAVIDSNNQIIVSSADFNKERFLGSENISRDKTQQKENNTNIYVKNLDNVSWRIVIVAKKLPFYFFQNPFLFKQIIYLIINIFICILMSAALASKSSKRLNKLRQTTGLNSKHNQTKGFYNDICIQMCAMQEQLSKIRQMDKKNHDMIRKASILQILNEIDIPEAKELFSKSTSQNPCIVAALCVPKKKAYEVFDRDRITSLLLRNFKGMCLNVDSIFDTKNNLVLLLWFNNNYIDRDVFSHTDYQVEKLALSLSEEERVFYGIGSDISVKTKDIYKHYMESIRDLDYKILTVGFEKTLKSKEEENLPDTSFEIEVGEYVKCRDWDGLRQMVTDNISGKELEEVKLVFLKLRAVIAKILSHCKDKECGFSELKKSSSVSELLDILRRYAEEEEWAEGKTKETYQPQIIEYIDKHYRNNNLSLQMIKSEFHISFSMISQVIYEIKNVGFLEYINRKRVNYAQEQLIATNEPISTIATLAGYNSDGTFIRNFKKYTNMTPGEYRKQESQESECQ